MNEILIDVTRLIGESGVRETVIHLLRTVPGLPPIVQSFHILGIACVMGTMVMIHLRILGLAVPSQNVSEMIQRLMPWTAWSLLVSLASGMVFVIARPGKYFFNPLFGLKFAFLFSAVVLGLVVYRRSKKEVGYWEASAGRRGVVRVYALVSLVLWVGVVLAGRWIAYVDYIFAPQ